MAQPPNSPKRPEAQQSEPSALAQYHSLMAARHFKPASSSSLPPLVSRAATPERFTPPISCPASPQPSAPSAPSPQAGTYAPLRTISPPPAYTPSPYANGFATPHLAFPHAPAHQPAHQPTHQPQQLSSNGIYGPFPGANTFTPQLPLLPPDSITRDMLAAHVQDLLRYKLPEFNMPQTVILASSLVNRIIHLGQNGRLGPYGLGHLDNIFLCVGHEGAKKYMALALIGKGQSCVLLKGTSEDLEGKEPLEDEKSMEWLRQGFFNVAVDEYNELNRAMQRGK